MEYPIWIPNADDGAPPEERARAERFQARVRGTFRAAAKREGLEFRPSYGTSPARLRGEIEGVLVECSLLVPRAGSHGTCRTIVDARLLALGDGRRGKRHGSTSKPLLRTRNASDSQPSGDSGKSLVRFDSWPSGALEDALAADERFLEGVPALWNAQLYRERLRLSGSGVVSDPIELAEIVRAAVRIARSLPRTRDESIDRLRKAAMTDENAEARARAQRRLVAAHREEPGVRDIALAALTAAHPGLRLAAAQSVGAAGASTLSALASNPTWFEKLRCDALGSLEPFFDVDRDVPLLAEILRARAPGRLLLLAVGLAGRRRVADLLPELDRLAEGSSKTMSQAIVQALSEIGPAAEDSLSRLLSHRAAETRLAAAKALGQAGTAASVERLRALETSGGDLRRAARAAIAAIQSRLEGATPGQLSVADAADPHGALSPAEDREGGLSQPNPRSGDGSPP